MVDPTKIDLERLQFFSTLLKYSIEAIVTQVPGIRDGGSPREVRGIGLCSPIYTWITLGG